MVMNSGVDIPLGVHPPPRHRGRCGPPSARLAQLADSARVPSGPALIAEVEGRLQAALPLERGGRSPTRSAARRIWWRSADARGADVRGAWSPARAVATTLSALERRFTPTFDLQSHSLHSDGALPAGEVVAAAAEAGVELLALSDHDTVDGVQQALDAASTAGIRVVTAVEISSVDRDQQDLHVLGYLWITTTRCCASGCAPGAGIGSSAPTRWPPRCARSGTSSTSSELERRKAEGKTIGRPHLADAVVRHPGNSERLRSEGLDERSAFLEAYLIDGKPAFKPRTKPTVSESIAAIHDAGGVAVWAHPFWDVKDAARGARDDRPLPGLRDSTASSASTPPTPASRPSCSPTAAPSSGCCSTGSSDFHGPAHRLFSRFRAFSTYGREPSLGPIAGPRARTLRRRRRDPPAIRPSADPPRRRAAAAPPPAARPARRASARTDIARRPRPAVAHTARPPR